MNCSEFSSSGNSIQLDLLARVKKEICMNKSEPIASCSFNPTRGFVMTVLDSITAAPAAVGNVSNV